MIAIVHSIYSRSVHAPALKAGLMDNDAERYCTSEIFCQNFLQGKYLSFKHREMLDGEKVDHFLIIIQKLCRIISIQ